MKSLFLISLLLPAASWANAITIAGVTPYGSEVVSFNPTAANSTGGTSQTITLGSQSCTSGDSTCTLSETNTPGGSGLPVTWTFTNPETVFDSDTQSISDITWGTVSSNTAPLTDSDLPDSLFSITDASGDSLSGTFNPTEVSEDTSLSEPCQISRTETGTCYGVDITGTLTLSAESLGFADTAAFVALFGSTGDTGTFDLAIGDCTSGGKAQECISGFDPTGQDVVSLGLNLTPNAVPEPGSLLLLGTGLGALATRKWLRRV